jgi:hypothetical protein
MKKIADKAATQQDNVLVEHPVFFLIFMIFVSFLEIGVFVFYSFQDLNVH